MSGSFCVSWKAVSDTLIIFRNWCGERSSRLAWTKKNSRRSFSPLQRLTMFKSYRFAAYRFIGRFRSCLWNNQKFYCLIKSREKRGKNFQCLPIIRLSNLKFHNIKAIDDTLTTLGPILSHPVDRKDMKYAHRIVFFVMSIKFLPYQFYLSFAICSFTSAIFLLFTFCRP